MLDITKDIQSLTTFRRRSGDFMKQLKKSKRPVVLTVKGKAAAIVQDAEAYQRLLDIAALADSEEGIRQGSMTWPTGAPAPPKRYLATSVANMAYHVEFADRAVRDIEALYVEKNAAEAPAASRWYNGLEEAVSALEAFPLRRPAAPGSSEDETQTAAPALRQETSHLSGHI